MTLISTRLLACSLVAVILLMVTACSGAQDAGASDTTPLPPGDAAHGAQLFSESVNGAPSCNTCHQTNDVTLVGPGIKGYAQRASTRVEGKPAEQYTRESIEKPASYIVPGFSNAMYNGYASKLSPQDMADLIAYLLSS